MTTKGIVQRQEGSKTWTKRHLRTARVGIKGEAYFELLMSDNAIVHKITTNKDTGVDFLCHWLDEDMPSNKMFAVQVKTRSSVTPTNLTTINKYNSLPEYCINSIDSKLTNADISFWKLFNIPVYLFVLIYGGEHIPECFYKRLTPSITLSKDRLNNTVIEKIKREPFYKIDPQRVHERSNANYGFYRDLCIDSVRCMYNMGAIYARDSDAPILYLDLLNEYSYQIMGTVESINQLKRFMKDNSSLKANYPSLDWLCDNDDSK